MPEQPQEAARLQPQRSVTDYRSVPDEEELYGGPEASESLASDPGAAEPGGTRRRRPETYQEDAYQDVQPLSPGGRGYGCADVITAIFLLLMVFVIAFTILLIGNPYSALNPFPPPTPLKFLVLASPLPTNTPTATFTPEPPTPTVPSPTPTATPTRTITLTPSQTFTPVFSSAVTVTPRAGTVTTAIPQPQFTRSPFPFTVDSIKFITNTGRDGCQWQGIVGTVLNTQGEPIRGLAVRITGSGGNIDEFHYTGQTPNQQTKLGDAGFEAFLGATPREDKYTVQLLGRTGAPISELVAIETKVGCQQNVVVITFVQNHAY